MFMNRAKSARIDYLEDVNTIYGDLNQTNKKFNSGSACSLRAKVRNILLNRQYINPQHKPVVEPVQCTIGCTGVCK